MKRDFFKFIVQKPLYYKEIDTNRIKIAFNKLKPHIKQPKAIHIIGTNGKGSTGRVIAHLANKAGIKVGHYSSPHILKFNERIWVNGKNVDNDTLEISHKRLFEILGEELSNTLSYFEYTTLLAFLIFENLDLIVLEAGLGGQMDATTVYENRDLSVVTPIGFDHQAFLGKSIKKIATTKLKSIKNEALIAPQKFDEVNLVAKKLSREIGFRLHFANLDSKKSQEVEKICSKKAYPEFLISNIKVAVKALDIFGINYNLDDLKGLELFGRFYKILPNVTIDVGHNLLSAKAIFNAMKKDTTLVYNTLDDKNYYEILKTLKPKIKEVEIIPIDTPRALNLNILKETLKDLNIPFKSFNKNIKKDKNYLVFGSFYTVEAFLKKLNLT